MKFRKLGRTDLFLSEISLGCSGYWGDKKYTEKKAALIVNEAYDRGVNFFDTGHNYSNFNAEPRLGRILKELLIRNDRSNIIISTKGGSINGVTPFLLKRKEKTQDFTPDAIEKSCIESIKNLNCNYIDIFQLHEISESQITESLIERLLTMKQKGMYRYLGVNTHIESTMRFISEHPEIFDMVSIDYSVLQLDRESIIKKLNTAEIGIIAGTVLAQGHLIKGKTGSISSGAFFWYLARALLKQTSYQLMNNSKQMRCVLSKITEMSSSQAAFSYILDNPAIASCTFGTTNYNNLVEIIESSGKLLDKSSKIAIKKAFEPIKDKISK